MQIKWISVADNHREVNARSSTAYWEILNSLTSFIYSPGGRIMRHVLLFYLKKYVKSVNGRKALLTQGDVK